MPALSDLLQSSESTTLASEGGLFTSEGANMASDGVDPPCFPYVNEHGQWKNVDDFRRRRAGDRETDYDNYPDLRPLLSLTRGSPNESIKAAMRDCETDSDKPASVQRDPEASSIYSQESVRDKKPQKQHQSPVASHQPLLLRLSSGRDLVKQSGDTPATPRKNTKHITLPVQTPPMAKTPTTPPSTRRDKLLGSPSSPDAPAASPLVKKSAMRATPGSTGRLRSNHARTRHEPLSGPNSPLDDLPVRRNVSAADDTSLRVAPLRLTDRKLKRRSSISEGQIAQLRAQLRGEIRVPPEENIFPPGPKPISNPLSPRATGAVTGDEQPYGVLTVPRVRHASATVSTNAAGSLTGAAQVPPSVPGFERRFTPIQDPFKKTTAIAPAAGAQLSPGSLTGHGSLDPSIPRVASTLSFESPPRVNSNINRVAANLAAKKRSPYDLPPPCFMQKRPTTEDGDAQATVNAKGGGTDTIKNANNGQNLLRRARGTSRPLLATKEPMFGATPTSPDSSGRPRHRPIVVKGYEHPTRDHVSSAMALTFDPPVEMRQRARDAVPEPPSTAGAASGTPSGTPSGTAAGTNGHKSSKSEGASRSTSTAIAEFFSWRRRKGASAHAHAHDGANMTTAGGNGNLTSKFMATANALHHMRPPSTAWSPFERTAPEPPSSSTWVNGEAEDDTEKDQRANFFRAKATEQAAADAAAAINATAPTAVTAAISPPSTISGVPTNRDAAVERTIYSVETLPRPQDRRPRSRPRVTAESPPSVLQHKFSLEAVGTRTSTSTSTTSTVTFTTEPEYPNGLSPPPPIPPLPLNYRPIMRTAASQHDMSLNGHREISPQQGRARRFAGQDPANTASEISLRGAFLRPNDKFNNQI